MLLTLRVRDFVLIPELELELGPGFNVLTGETGAGKSIVVGAIHAVLGGRISAETIRTGADEAEVEAAFDAPGLAPQMEAAGIPFDGTLVVRRVIQRTGRSKVYLNGRLSTVGELAGMAHALADVASQHESVALTDPSTHLGYLDRFGQLEAEQSELAGAVEELQNLQKELNALREAERTKAEREDFLAYQLQQIRDIAPQVGELDELQAERSRLRHAAKLAETTARIALRIDASAHDASAHDGGDTRALADELSRLAHQLADMAEIDAQLQPLADRLSASVAELRDVSGELMPYAEALNANPTRLHQLEERLFRLEGLLRRMGPTIDEVLASEQQMAQELEQLQGASDRIAELEALRSQRLAVAAQRADALSKKRKEAAARLGKAISRELGELGMGGARIIVDVAPLDGAKDELVVHGARLSRDGIDQVEFLIAPNKGIDPRPLRKIASGGELSRALLALKRTLAGSVPAGLYVFDEVDSGVGGAVADKIGRAILDVSHHHQVLCITHQAPIAAYAHHHFVVRKDQAGDLASTGVVALKPAERVQEIARMLSGAEITASARKTAKELLQHGAGVNAAPPG